MPDLTSVALDVIKIASPQEGDDSPDAVFNLRFNFDGPGDRIGSEVTIAVATPFNQSATVPELTEAAVKNAIAIFANLGAMSASELHQMVKDNYCQPPVTVSDF